MTEITLPLGEILDDGDRPQASPTAFAGVVDTEIAIADPVDRVAGSIAGVADTEAAVADPVGRVAGSIAVIAGS